MHGCRNKERIVKRQISLRVKDKEVVDDHNRPLTDGTGRTEEVNRIVIPHKIESMPKAKWTGEGTVPTTCRACVNGYQNGRKDGEKINVANVKEAVEGHDRHTLMGNGTEKE